MTVLIAATEPTSERAEAALSARETVRARSLGEVRERAPEVDAVVAGTVSDGDSAAVTAAVERAAPGTPVVAAADPELATAVEHAIEVSHYRDAVDELYEVARQQAVDGEAQGADVHRARSAADDAFERMRRVADRTPYDLLLEDERNARDDD